MKNLLIFDMQKGFMHENITSYGKTFLVKDGKCKELCKDFQTLDLSYAIYGIV